jgi:uncharacterized protein
MRHNQGRPEAALSEGRPSAFAHRRPMTAFLLLAFGTGWTALMVALLADLPVEPFLLFLSYVSLLGSAVFVTRAVGGPGAVRALLSRLLIWRFGLGRWIVIMFGVPVLTVAVAAVWGTLETPGNGWGRALADYVVAVVVLGVLVNMWEETGWGGFAQSHLMARHGLLVGSLLTAPLFAGIHLPLQFLGDAPRSQIVTGIAVLFAAAPVYRYLLGMHLLDTGGSILAIAVQHASWNASQDLGGDDGWWQSIVAVALLTLLLALQRRMRHKQTSPVGLEAEKAAAADWLAVGPADAGVETGTAG